MSTFIEQLEEIKKIKTYSEKKQNLLDDMASAYIADNKGDLNESIKSIKTMRKALKMKGYSLREINEYILQYSYLSKSKINRMFSQSMYNEDNSIKSVVECVPFFTPHSTTDLIINELKTRPALVRALKKNIDNSSMQKTYNVKNPALIKKFFAQYENLITE